MTLCRFHFSVRGVEVRLIFYLNILKLITKMFGDINPNIIREEFITTHILIRVVKSFQMKGMNIAHKILNLYNFKTIFLKFIFVHFFISKMIQKLEVICTIA